MPEPENAVLTITLPLDWKPYLEELSPALLEFLTGVLDRKVVDIESASASLRSIIPVCVKSEEAETFAKRLATAFKRPHVPATWTGVAKQILALIPADDAIEIVEIALADDFWVDKLTSADRLLHFLEKGSLSQEWLQGKRRKKELRDKVETEVDPETPNIRVGIAPPPDIPQDERCQNCGGTKREIRQIKYEGSDDTYPMDFPCTACNQTGRKNPETSVS